MAGEQPQHDDDDFGELAELHRAMLLRVALRLSGNPEIAKDLVQETLLRGLSHRRQLDQTRNPAGWLVTILTNLFFDQLKHRKVEDRAEHKLAEPEVGEDDSDSLLSQIADADLHAAVQALEPELRAVVELCYLKELRYREVAAALRVPIGTIGTRLMRARERLRALLTSTSRTP